MFSSTQDTTGFALKGHVMYTENEVADPTHCMSYCNLQEGCESFNFNSRDQICELNNATKEIHDADYKAEKSFVYYEKAGRVIGIGETSCKV